MGESESTDETYTPESIALVQVSGTGVHNNKAVQVETVRDHPSFFLSK